MDKKEKITRQMYQAEGTQIKRGNKIQQKETLKLEKEMNVCPQNKAIKKSILRSVLVAERRGNFFFEERGNSKKRQSKERFILLYTCPKNSSPSSR